LKPAGNIKKAVQCFMHLTRQRGQQYVQSTGYEKRQKETAPENSEGKAAGEARKEE
jgi:hypothetical protein